MTATKDAKRERGKTIQTKRWKMNKKERQKQKGENKKIPERERKRESVGNTHTFFDTEMSM